VHGHGRAIPKIERVELYRAAIFPESGGAAHDVGLVLLEVLFCEERLDPPEVHRGRCPPCSGQSVSQNVQRSRGGLTFKAHRLAFHSTLGSSNKEEERTSITSPVLSSLELSGQKGYGPTRGDGKLYSDSSGKNLMNPSLLKFGREVRGVFLKFAGFRGTVGC